MWHPSCFSVISHKWGKNRIVITTNGTYHVVIQDTWNTVNNISVVIQDTWNTVNNISVVIQDTWNTVNKISVYSIRMKTMVKQNGYCVCQYPFCVQLYIWKSISIIKFCLTIQTICSNTFWLWYFLYSILSGFHLNLKSKWKQHLCIQNS